MHKHRKELEFNHRLRMLYTTWDNMGTELQKQIIHQAEKYLSGIDSL